MVRLAGIEPAWLSPRDFKSLVSTYFTTAALCCVSTVSIYVSLGVVNIYFGTDGEIRTLT